MPALCVHSQSKAASATLNGSGREDAQRPRRLLFILPGFPADELDDTCLPAVQTYVRAAARDGIADWVGVLAIHYPYESREYDWNGAHVWALGAGNRRSLFRLDVWRRALRIVNDAQPDLLHSFWVGECAVLGELGARRLRCGHVASIAGQELRQPGLYARWLRRGSFVLTAGSDQAAETARRGLRRGVDAIIPLGMDLGDLPSPAPEVSDGRDHTGFDVLYVGSLIPVKRPEDALAVADMMPHVRFGMIGDGPLREALETRAGANVVFTGFLPRHRVLRHMQYARILLHPAEYEAQGFVFLEALATGMHVVCRDVGAPGHSDRVHRCETPDEMGAVIDAILSRSEERRAVEVPTVEQTIASYAAVYRQALTRALAQ